MPLVYYVPEYERDAEQIPLAEMAVIYFCGI